jgi:hypothetical protein
MRDRTQAGAQVFGDERAGIQRQRNCCEEELGVTGIDPHLERLGQQLRHAEVPHQDLHQHGHVAVVLDDDDDEHLEHTHRQRAQRGERDTDGNGQQPRDNKQTQRGQHAVPEQPQVTVFEQEREIEHVAARAYWALIGSTL